MESILQFEAWIPLWLRFVAGFVLLIVGAEFLVRGASSLAQRFGVSPLVVGLTVVSFGTSAPELAVSVGGSLSGEADVAVGNIVGSNVMNVLLILGLAAVITPLIVRDRLVRFDVPLLIGVSLAAWLMSADGVIGRLEGSILVATLVLYLATLLFGAREGKTAPEANDAEAAPSGSVPGNVGLILLGLLGLTLGARWLVEGAVATAEWAGLSKLVIGLTVVAIGTSLPEIATSVLAAYRGERDVAVGNVVGSNLFNLMFVLGLTAILPPAGVAVSRAAFVFDLPVMVASAVVLLPILFTGGRISRREGALLLAYFVAYMAYLLLAANQHAAAKPFSWAVLAFAVPLTVVGLTLTVIASARDRRKRAKRLARLRGDRASRPTAPGAAS